MKRPHLRTLNTAGAVLASFGAGAAAGGCHLAAIVAIALSILLFAWSLEQTRAAASRSRPQ